MCSRPLEGLARTGHVLQYEIERPARHVFRRHDLVAALASRAAEQLARGVDACDREPRRLPRARLGE